MRVVVNEKMKIFHGHVAVPLAAGQVVRGSLAQLLLERAPGKVTRLDQEAATPVDEGSSGETPVHREPCVDGSVCGGPHCPPEADPNASQGDGGAPDPAPSPDLDINASAAKVMAWVGEDQERAQQALEAEQAKESPRSTLIKQLEALRAKAS